MSLARMTSVTFWRTQWVILLRRLRSHQSASAASRQTPSTGACCCQCIACDLTKPLLDIFQTPCGHYYGQECLRALFELSTTDETLFRKRYEIQLQRYKSKRKINMVTRRGLHECPRLFVNDKFSPLMIGCAAIIATRKYRRVDCTTETRRVPSRCPIRQTYYFSLHTLSVRDTILPLHDRNVR